MNERTFKFPYAKFQYSDGGTVYYLRNIEITNDGLHAEWFCKGFSNWLGVQGMKGGFYLDNCASLVGLKKLPNFIKA